MENYKSPDSEQIPAELIQQEVKELPGLLFYKLKERRQN
jgi:hypothetical protein